MPFFIKIETIKREFLINKKEKNEAIRKHISWIKSLRAKGKNVQSGYLVDYLDKPGGGGLLIIESNSFKEAKEILENDPMIKDEIVEWQLHKWIDVIS